MMIRIENEDVLPKQVIHMNFETIDELLFYLNDTKTYRNIHISCIDKVENTLWILYLKSDKDFLKDCQKDGYCGICDGKIDCNTEMPQFNREHLKNSLQKDWIYCGNCGRQIGEMQHLSLIDIFNQCVNMDNVEHKFTSVNIECGRCQETGEIDIYDEEYGVYPIGKDVCPFCFGKKYINIELIDGFVQILNIIDKV